MPTTAPDPVRTIRDAVKRWLDAVGPGLFGLGCSGGADSMALADAMIAQAGAAHVVVLVIDHGLQAASATIAASVAAWARGQGAAAVVRRVEVARRASLEAAARDARYAAFDQLADELGLAAIFLAHTARDQAETVLMRIVRGTGPAGLAGIPARRGRFVRPLLELPRATVDAYVRAQRLPVHEDPMNEDRAFTRVRFREHVMPVLRIENPAVETALLRLAAAAREWAAALDELARPHAQLPVDCARLATLPPAIAKRALALAFGGPNVDALYDLAMRPAAGELTLDLPGLRVTRSYDRLLLRPEARSPKPEAVRPEASRSPPGHHLRTWRAGDRMRPARLKGRSKKLSDLYIDAKLPRALRATAQVLVRDADEVIVWAEHVGPAFDADPNIIPTLCALQAPSKDPC